MLDLDRTKDKGDVFMGNMQYIISRLPFFFKKIAAKDHVICGFNSIQ